MPLLWMACEELWSWDLSSHSRFLKVSHRVFYIVVAASTVQEYIHLYIIINQANQKGGKRAQAEREIVKYCVRAPNAASDLADWGIEDMTDKGNVNGPRHVCDGDKGCQMGLRDRYKVTWMSRG